jgi:arylsulfatase A-like enzyme
VLILTIDTLRADHLSAYGYERPTTPRLDRVIRSGAIFTQARTVEPLTGPALCAMITSTYPHENGATRNGLRMRVGLDSLPKLLRAAGYRTAAVVSNWTLRDKLTGMGEHFDDFEEVIKHKRWFGLFSGEAAGDQVTDRAIEWIEHRAAEDAAQPFLLWVHYVDPHAPYVKHKAYFERLGIAKTRGKLSIGDRYDTEIAYVDEQSGRFLDRFEELGLADGALMVFAADHGESLGEHDYVGHGRHLYEPSLHIPMSVSWPGRIEPQEIAAPASNIDLAPTIAGLLGIEAPEAFRGYDWTAVLGGADPPEDRATRHQAHRGAVLTRHDSDAARRAGLLEVGLVAGRLKDILRKGSIRRRFDLTADPSELVNLAEPRSEPTGDLRAWMERVDSGLQDADQAPTQELDDETIERLRALGYAD